MTYIENAQVELKRILNDSFEKEVVAFLNTHDGVPPAIYWYEDRVEIISYGGIPKGLTKEQFLNRKTKPVDKELMDIFLQCKIMDQAGYGVPTIVSVYGIDAYNFSDDSITVTIPFYNKNFKYKNVGINLENDKDENKNVGINLKSDKDEDKNVGINLENDKDRDKNVGINLKDNELKVFEQIKDNPNITIYELSEKLSKTIRTIERIIVALKEKGLVNRVGSKKNGYWKITK